MSNPFEDTFYRFLLSRRWTDRVFLALTVIGVTYAALQPFKWIYDLLLPPAIKALRVAPPQEVKHRMDCAYQIGVRRALYEISAGNVVHYRPDISKLLDITADFYDCAAGIAAARVLTASNSGFDRALVSGNIDGHSHDVPFDLLAGRVCQTDFAACSVIGLAYNLTYVRLASRPNPLSGVTLAPFLMDDINKRYGDLLTKEYSQFRVQFSYYLPEHKVDGSSAKALRDSIDTLEQSLLKLWRSEA